MKASGRTTRLTVKEHSGMFMAICTKVTGKGTKLTARENTPTATDRITMECGATMFNMVMEQSIGKTAVNMLESIIEVKNIIIVLIESCLDID